MLNALGKKIEEVRKLWKCEVMADGKKMYTNPEGTTAFVDFENDEEVAQIKAKAEKFKGDGGFYCYELPSPGFFMNLECLKVLKKI